jgi:hypothetical protein
LSYEQAPKFQNENGGKIKIKLTWKSPPQIIGTSSKVRPPMAAKIEAGRLGKAGHEKEGFWRSMISTLLVVPAAVWPAPTRILE